MSGPRAITIVGISDDGCVGLSSRAVNAVAAAQVLAGGERHLAFFPQFRGIRITLKDGLAQALDRIAEAADEHHVCILASGDPMFFGVGALVIKGLGAEHV
ncbi:MAG TPA: SAM-dependent methyltransferase, partial [Candidatus Binataceae bacterium]|nr:SAM-dependent methyltransferase [Candidatus Binataceae bacterium]